MSFTSNTTTTIRTSLIRLARANSDRHDWYVVTTTETLTRSKVDPDPEHLTGSIELKLQAVNELGLDRSLPTQFGGRFDWHIPSISRATVKATNGYVLIEDRADRGRGLGTHLMSHIIRWLQAHAAGEALLYPIELEPGISEANAERVRRFYARFGLNFEQDQDSRARSTGWNTPLKALKTPATPAGVTVYDEVDGWLAFFAELRTADERRHGDQLSHQWRSADLRATRARRDAWLQAGALVAIITLAAQRLFR